MIAHDAFSIVTDFCAAWRSRQADQIMAFLTADCVYHNIPWAPLAGHEAIRAAIEPFLADCGDVEFILRQAAATADGGVLTERLDRFLVKGVWREVPVMGAFELTAGKISQWRDYFDVGMFQRAFGAPGV